MTSRYEVELVGREKIPYKATKSRGEDLIKMIEKEITHNDRHVLLHVQSINSFWNKSDEARVDFSWNDQVCDEMTDCASHILSN